MQPTVTDLKKWLAGKFQPMLDSNIELQNTYAKPRGREGVNTHTLKEFAGGAIYFAWGSPNTWRGISTPIVICDESEAYDGSDEGYPVDVLWQRSRDIWG